MKFTCRNSDWARFTILPVACLAMLIGTGCEKAPSPEFRFNEVEWLAVENSLGDDEKLPAEYREQVGTLVTALFGTPDEPDFPFYLGEEDPGHTVLDLENLKRAAGPVRSDENGVQFGLYREHCAQCHGVTGDGAGPTAAFLNPYPRDFRLGKFKFKSTPLLKVPTNDDLNHILRRGIPGTAMPAFSTLEDEEIDALVDYVKYLSIRGQFERRMISLAVEDLGETLVDLELLSMSEEDEDYEDRYDDFLDRMFQFVIDILHDEERIVDRWTNPDRGITKVPDAPPAFSRESSGHPELVEKGKTLFHGVANCTQCHGETGVGDAQLTNYDDWTKSWTNSIRFDPHDPDSYAEFTAAGALKPRIIRPRNLRMRVYRGGGSPDSIYRRIKNGIEGSGMPSAPALKPDEVWALVAYVQSMPYEDDSPAVAPTNEQPVR